MLNMDFSVRVAVNTNEVNWAPSPIAGVWRKPLAREDAERGHATSLVRYDPGSAFSSHTHEGGEEILVLEGLFSDQFGDFPAGTYFRNPPGTSHTPSSEPGCLLLVKLHQFAEGDTRQFHLDTSQSEWTGEDPGIERLPLHAFGSEFVAMERWFPGARQESHPHPGGEEWFVLSGVLRDEHGSYPAGTWLRQPPGSRHAPHAEEETVVWVKSGHLPG